MKKTILMEKYPVFSLEIQKSETSYKNVNEIIEFLKTLIDGHKVAVFISVFDQYTHTKSIGGEINEKLLDAKNLIFCFGKAIPNSKILATRPRSFGVCETKGTFLIDFLEPPREEMTQIMEKWAKSVVNI
ncbi:DUF6858 family protein [Sulfurimonas sp.]|uniref:DUF6858 family protein n=1 Tax=Sulfurimonas sp. TaxID=2022749 RepID=UPI002B49DC15|nr:hypothetical protein [Sulfurimonas sp.]